MRAAFTGSAEVPSSGVSESQLSEFPSRRPQATHKGICPESQPTQLISFQSCSSTRHNRYPWLNSVTYIQTWSVSRVASRTSTGAGGQGTEGSGTTGAAAGEQGKWRASQVALTHVCLGKWAELIAFSENAGEKNPTRLQKRHDSNSLH